MNFGEIKLNKQPSGQVYIIKGEDFSDQNISVFAQQLRFRGGGMIKKLEVQTHKMST